VGTTSVHGEDARGALERYLRATARWPNMDPCPESSGLTYLNSSRGARVQLDGNCEAAIRSRSCADDGSGAQHRARQRWAGQPGASQRGVRKQGRGPMRSVPEAAQQ
jgi:hypothetical protein